MIPQIVRGPFNLLFGPNTLAAIATLKIAYSVDTTDTATVQGQKIRTFGAHQVIVTATFLKSDVPALAIALAQYFVPNGGVLSSGETVNDSRGAIDLVPGGCASASNPLDLIIESCGTNAPVLRVMDCISEISGLTVDEQSLTVDVDFTGQSTGATIQMFAKNAISNLS